MTKKISLLLVASLLSFSPFLVSAAGVGFPYWPSQDVPLVSCTGASCNLCGLLSTIQRIIYFLMTLILFAVGPAMIVVGGLMMLIAAGSEERFSSGRKIATSAVIGIAIALGAFIVLNTFLSVIANTAKLTEVGLNLGTTGWTIQCQQ